MAERPQYDQPTVFNFLHDYGCDLQVNSDATVFSCNDTATIRLEINDNYVSGPAEDDATRTVRLNTVDYRDDPYQADSADRIRVEIIEDAPVYFMKLFGFFKIPVKGSATAENINHLDIALVFDRSGSMEFDTLCYGCWTAATGTEYPEGNRHPLPWDGDTNGQPDHCEGSTPWVYSGNKYIIIEAEEYGMLSNAYNRDLYTQGYTYWVLAQRQPDSRLPRARRGKGPGCLRWLHRTHAPAHFRRLRRHRCPLHLGGPQQRAHVPPG